MTGLKLFRVFRHSLRALSDQKGKAFLMMLGTAVGIMLLTGVVGLSRGVEKRIEDMMAFFGPRSGMIFSGGGRLQSASGRTGSGATLKMQDLEALRTKESEKAIFSTAIRRENIPVRYENQTTDTSVFAVDPDFAVVSEWETAGGEPLDSDDEKSMNRVCLLGSTLARNLFFEDDPIGKRILINKVPFKVKGLLATKGSNPMGMDMDDCAWIPLQTGMRRVFHVDNIGMIRFKIREGFSIASAKNDIDSLLRDRHKIKENEDADYMIRTPDFIAQRISSMTRTTRLAGYALAIIALIVGGVVLMNILLLSVSERIPEIGLKRALGATEKDIFMEFLSEAVAVSLMGMLLGIVMGVAPVLLLPKFMPMLPMAFSFKAFTYGFIFSFAVGVFFGVQPARRASKLTPIEALR
jgi:putative ABC transport system permease protein